MRKARIIGGAACAALALLLAGGCGTKKQAENYRLVPVGRDDLRVTVLATGNVQPQNQLAVLPPISGRIEKIFIKEGDHVKKGQKLMEMSSTERATLLDVAAAKGPEALAHWEQLYQTTPILSPENGQVIYLPTVPGQVVGTGVTLLVMSDHLIVDTQVDETDLSQIKIGQEADIDLDAYPGRTIPAKVRRISYQSTLVNNVTNYEVDVWPDQVPAFMRSGMTANVTFHVAQKADALVVPSEALKSNPDGQFYVLLAPAKAGGKPIPQVVTTGITDGKETEILSGLKEGDKIALKTFSAGQYSATGSGTNPFLPSRHGSGGKSGGGH
ncbi:MAG TPA: efflux RND transporter periplasmic adaptor subunit [bacterium]|nr:efflux RND transporter periplasmic adaptor subunit [bacterium]